MTFFPCNGSAFVPLPVAVTIGRGASEAGPLAGARQRSSACRLALRPPMVLLHQPRIRPMGTASGEGTTPCPEPEPEGVVLTCPLSKSNAFASDATKRSPFFASCLTINYRASRREHPKSLRRISPAQNRKRVKTESAQINKDQQCRTKQKTASNVLALALFGNGTTKTTMKYRKAKSVPTAVERAKLKSTLLSVPPATATAR
ncbi:hypothetical protein SAMN03097708_00844 [Thiohalomonas denitrificans]|uniref:Uncharacterized protein n=1 Tax=Thiohalomonas denitrificans TaxID=415747 RepID=A0A1G5PTU1_9GAMM|nr:hypothetical protein SAMN03097708_00844 [Thiohalomonas denitrificans]